MPDHPSNGMQCHEFDALISDAIDGVLKGSQLEGFQAHARECPACGPLLAEAEAGRNWLKELSEVEPPAKLVANILASTTGVDTQRLWAVKPVSPLRISWWERAQAWASGILEPVWGTVRQPRFAMSFGMAFFSLSVALSVAGVRPTDLRQVSLRPAALRHTYYSTQARVIRYYENIRLVYEVQSRVREFQRSVTPAEPGSRKEKERKNDTTQSPEQKQERNYSQRESNFMLADAPAGPSVNDLPVVSVSTYRRLV